ncbi:MAG: glycosyltransferase family 39 protein [Candidatus Magasanikbacteria bacterium]|nr:glycosyltransferase family 39 protein [Candidatus Magasanikbacteria bacterium]
MNLNKLKNIIKKNWRGALVFFVAFLFFCGTAGYNYLTHRDGMVKWAAPDENANYVFTKLFAETGKLQIFEKYNLIADDIIVPRSFRSDQGNIKPMSFLGIILIYGWIGKLIGVGVIPYLTPFFGALGIVFLYFAFKKIFHPNNALISTLLLAVFPPYIYYSARSMFHNVLFISLMIIALNFILEMAGKDKGWKRLFSSALAGIFFGLGVATRTSELMWLLPVLLFIWLANFLRVNIFRLFVFVLFFVITMLPFLYQNNILYGSYFSGGYVEMNKSISTLTSASTALVSTSAIGHWQEAKEFITKIKDTIFYFGFHPRQSVKMLYYYFAKMFWWIFWPGFLGLLILLAQYKKMRKRHWVYLGAGFVLSTILILYYGSWEFHDNPDPKSFTIGNSYTRYWLPIYIFTLPLVSLFIMKLTAGILKILSKIINFSYQQKFLSPAFRSSLFLGATRAIIVILAMFISLQFVLIGSDEGLVFTLGRQKNAKAEVREVLSLTENDSVIITKYHDKLLFPERKVIYGLFDNDEMLVRYKRLSEILPLYYYSFTFPAKDMEFLNTKRLPPFGLKIEAVKQVTGDFTLYRMSDFGSQISDF